MRSLFTFYCKSGLFLLIWVVFFASRVCAANIEVNARLSEEETAVGEPVQLEITVQGSRNAEVPRDVNVEGLQSRYVGQSVQIQMLNFQVSTSSAHTFVILPLRAGDFTIPALEVKIDGKAFRTKPLHLQVKARSSGMGNPGGVQQQGAAPQQMSSSMWGVPAAIPPVSSRQSVDSQADKVAFGVLMLPKKQLYVGEVVPVEIRYYFHSDLPVQSINSMPSLIEDDVVVQKMLEPQQGQQEVKGVKYTTVSFRTSIRPLKAGTLRLPATSITCQILTQARQQIPGGLMPDAFFQSFFNSMPGMTSVQKLEVKSVPITIKVVPLPEENRPDSFHGAIGNFSLSTDAFPQNPAPGDPVTLRAIVSGEGNFGQMNAPDLASAQGWQTYPPTAKFMGSNSIEYSGKKIFDWMLVPKENKTTTPALKFSYFNPTSNKYVTLQGDSQPIHAVAAPVPLSAALPAGVAVPSPPSVGSIASSSTEDGDGNGRLKIATNVNPATFLPLTARPEFVFTNGVALLALLTFLGIQLARYYAASGRGNQANLRRALAVYRARASVSEGKEFYSTVVEFLRLRTASSSRDIKVHSGEEVIDALGLQDEEAKLVLEIFSRYEEFTYGAQEIQRPLSTEIRAAVLQLLNKL